MKADTPATWEGQLSGGGVMASSPSAAPWGLSVNYIQLGLGTGKTGAAWRLPPTNPFPPHCHLDPERFPIVPRHGDTHQTEPAACHTPCQPSFSPPASNFVFVQASPELQKLQLSYRLRRKESWEWRRVLWKAQRLCPNLVKWDWKCRAEGMEGRAEQRLTACQVRGLCHLARLCLISPPMCCEAPHHLPELGSAGARHRVQTQVIKVEAWDEGWRPSSSRNHRNYF